MKKIKGYECIRVFSPGNIINAYAGWKFAVVVILSVLSAAVLRAGKLTDDLSIKILTFIPAVAAGILILTADLPVSVGIAAGDNKKNRLYKSSAHFCEYLRKAVICSEIRKIIWTAASVIPAAIAGKFSSGRYIPEELMREGITVMLTMYAVVSLYIFVFRRINNTGMAFNICIGICYLLIIAYIFILIAGISMSKFLIPMLTVSVFECIYFNINVCRNITRKNTGKRTESD